MAESSQPDRNLAMEAVLVTEATALAASRHMGRGDELTADQAAVDSMHGALMTLAIDGTIRIGEGQAGEVAKLFVGETVGTRNGPAVDVALLPLEGPTVIARGEPNGVSVLVLAGSGELLAVPPIYMEKIAVGCGLPENVVSLDVSPGDNLRAVATAKGVAVADLVVCTLDRPRHGDIIRQIREAGARIRLIADGDLSGVIATTQPQSGVDIYMGVGGAREGVLAAAALSCVGGRMQARLKPRDHGERTLIAALGVDDPDRLLTVTDMARGDLTVALTGVTGGMLLSGVHAIRGATVTHSLVMGARNGTVRYIETHHDYAGEIGPRQRAGGGV